MLWFNDPDVIELQNMALQRRLPDGTVVSPMSAMTDDEIEFHKAFAVACGGMMLSGDLIYDLTDENIGVMKKLVANTGTAAKFDDYTLRIGRTKKDGKTLIELFNWGDEPQELNIPLEGNCRISDFWTGESLGNFSGSMKLSDMPAHSGRVLVCEPV